VSMINPSGPKLCRGGYLNHHPYAVQPLSKRVDRHSRCASRHPSKGVRWASSARGLVGCARLGRCTGDVPHVLRSRRGQPHRSRARPPVRPRVDRRTGRTGRAAARGMGRGSAPLGARASRPRSSSSSRRHGPQSPRPMPTHHSLLTRSTTLSRPRTGKQRSSDSRSAPATRTRSGPAPLLPSASGARARPNAAARQRPCRDAPRHDERDRPGRHSAR
jgi:hypothetical protein